MISDVPFECDPPPRVKVKNTSEITLRHAGGGHTWTRGGGVKLKGSSEITFSRESKYEIRVLRVIACVRKFLYTVTKQMRVYRLKLTKFTKKMAKIRPGAANGRTASAHEK